METRKLQKTKVVASAYPTPKGAKIKISTEYSWIVREVYKSLASFDSESADRYLAMHTKQDI